MRIKLLAAKIAGFFGYAMDLCSFDYGNNRITYRADGWVVISDGVSTDALPITLVSPELVTRIMQELGIEAAGKEAQG